MKRLFFALVGSIVVLALALVLIISVVRPIMDLSSYRGLVEGLASDVLGHKINLGGDLELSISMKPSVRLTDVSVDFRDDEKSGKLLQIEKTELGLALFPLLNREIYITRFIVDGFDLNLRAGDDVNSTPQAPGQQKSTPVPDSSKTDIPVLIVRIDTFSGRNFDLSYVNPDLKQEFQFSVAEFDSTLAHAVSDPKNTDFRTYLASIDFNFNASDGRLLLKEDETQYRFNIYQSVLSAQRDKPVSFGFSGSYLDQTVKSKFTTNSIAEIAAGLNTVDLGFSMETASTALNISGANPLPLSLDNVQFSLSFEGAGLEEFENLTGIDFPPTGAYALSGNFKRRNSRASISDLVLKLGDSEMVGDLHLDNSGQIPDARVTLQAKSIQLDDFALERWAGLMDRGRDQDQNVTPEKATDESSEDELQSAISPFALKQINLDLGLTVDTVLSGPDRLGRGEIAVKIQDGALMLSPLEIEVPGGGIHVTSTFKPEKTGNLLALAMTSDGFDYGNLAKRLDKSSKIGGEINLDLDLTTQWKEDQPPLSGGNGHLHFGVWPRELNAGVLDFWATNLLIALVPVLDNSDNSKINCLIAKFQMQDGVLRTDDVFVDTDKIQATAIGEVDFTNSTLNFGARPRPKVPQMFSARTPVQVQGDFSDFQYGLKEGALMGTAFRIITSPIVTPFEWVFRSPPPRDGKAPCQSSWENRKK